jgi:GNAT superfamily N-acetyltransferase
MEMRTFGEQEVGGVAMPLPSLRLGGGMSAAGPRAVAFRLVLEWLLNNPRAFTEKVAIVLGATAVSEPAFSGFVCSDFDPFLNHLFATRKVTAHDVARALDGRPGFVWLPGESPGVVGGLAVEGLMMAAMQGMTATIAEVKQPGRNAAEIVEVRASAELDAWLEVYFEVFGADPEARNDWHRVHDALGPLGDGSLSLRLANMGGVPAATGAMFYDQCAVGLYCFTTRESYRRRGLASALVAASHAAARARGVEQAVLHATELGQPVYIAAGYRTLRSLPVLISRSRKK